MLYLERCDQLMINWLQDSKLNNLVKSSKINDNNWAVIIAIKLEETVIKGLSRKFGQNLENLWEK